MEADCEKEGASMRVAVTYEDGEVYPYFGHTEEFKIYDIVDGRVSFSEILATKEYGHDDLITFLYHQGVDAVICGGIGTIAQTALIEEGIAVYSDVMGTVDEAIIDFVRGRLTLKTS